MRKVVAGLFITADGVTEEPSNWQEHFDEDMGAELGKHLAETDAILLGRVTYTYWVDYWPTQSPESDADFAHHINNTPKYVVSDTLSEVHWGKFNTVTLVRGKDLAATLDKLKQQPGKNIAVSGSPTLVRRMIEADLLDELTLIVHPVLAARGKRLFDGLHDLKRLDLVSTRSTRMGTVFITYHLRKPDTK
ncbi:MAG: dihydrofolate reductase family protein [Anaerolineae bacterium]|nr:dihydrofolate reductase family protein [Anaerolineae bacterium]